MINLVSNADPTIADSAITNSGYAKSASPNNVPAIIRMPVFVTNLPAIYIFKKTNQFNIHINQFNKHTTI